MSGKKVFVIIIEGIIHDICYSSLKEAAENAGLNYWTVQRKWSIKKSFSRKGKTLRELSLTKIKGRGRKN